MRTRKLLTTFSLLALLPMAASAAVAVTWNSEASLAGDGSVVINTGVLYAYNAGATEDFTVNGVTFVGTSTGTNPDFAGQGNVTLDPVDNGGNAGFSNQAGDYGTLLDSATWMPGPGATVTLHNLVDGQDYLVQLFSSDTRGARNSNLDLDLGQPNAFQTTLGNGSTGGGGVDGLYVLGSFTADATGEASFTLDYTGNGNANINAILVAAVPEPSVALLGGLGFLGLIRRRR